MILVLLKVEWKYVKEKKKSFIDDIPCESTRRATTNAKKAPYNYL